MFDFCTNLEHWKRRKQRKVLDCILGVVVDDDFLRMKATIVVDTLEKGGGKRTGYTDDCNLQSGWYFVLHTVPLKVYLV